MYDEYGFLKRETLTEAAQKFKFPNYKLRALWEATGCFNRALSGIYAKWRTTEADDTLDKDFVSEESQSQPMDLGKRGSQSARMQMTFKYKSFPAEMVGNVEEAEAIVADEIMQMRMVAGDQLDEYMLVGMLQDSIATTVDGVARTITPGIPAGNKTTAASAWSDASADVAADVEEDLQIIRNHGFEPRYALATGKVFNSLKKNTVAKDYLARMGIGQDAFVKGELPDLFGLTWIKYDAVHSVFSGSPVRFLTEGKVIYFPEPSRSWTEFQVGRVAMGGGEQVGQGIPTFPMTNGWASWYEKTNDPPGFVVRGRYARLPVLKVPSLVVVRTTGIT